MNRPSSSYNLHTPDEENVDFEVDFHIAGSGTRWFKLEVNGSGLTLFLNKEQEKDLRRLLIQAASNTIKEV